jgi:hypothetical protein
METLRKPLLPKGLLPKAACDLYILADFSLPPIRVGQEKIVQKQEGELWWMFDKGFSEFGFHRSN